MDTSSFYGVRRRLQRLQVSNSNDEDDLELLPGSDTDTHDSDYKLPDYGKICNLYLSLINSPN